jgi:hypothetical protein
VYPPIQLPRAHIPLIKAPEIFHHDHSSPDLERQGSIVIDRVVLREVVCRSWDEESYELLYNVDEGRGFESMQVCRRTYSESVDVSGLLKGRIF